MAQIEQRQLKAPQEAASCLKITQPPVPLFEEYFRFMHDRSTSWVMDPRGPRGIGRDGTEMIMHVGWSTTRQIENVATGQLDTYGLFGNRRLKTEYSTPASDGSKVSTKVEWLEDGTIVENAVRKDADGKSISAFAIGFKADGTAKWAECYNLTNAPQFQLIYRGDFTRRVGGVQTQGYKSLLEID